MAGHAVQGRGHALNNTVCQDKVQICRFKGKRSAFVALADGAGSCTNSHLGAGFAVMEIGKIVRKNFDRFRMDPGSAGPEIVDALQSGLASLAKAEGVDIKSLSSTFLFVYARISRKAIHYIAGHIGDGVIGMLENGSLRVLSHPQKGEYANSTIFLTSSKAASYLRIYSGSIRGNAGFLLMSDGTAESLYLHRSRQFAPACKKILKWFEKHSQEKVRAAFARNLDEIFREKTFDDCSIAAMAITGTRRIRKGKKGLI